MFGLAIRRSPVRFRTDTRILFCIRTFRAHPSLTGHPFVKIKLLAASLLTISIIPALAEDDGLSFSASNTLDLLGNVRGGIRTGMRSLDKLDLNAEFSGDDAGWNGWDALLHVQWTADNDLSGSLVGDAQGVSNIDAPEGWRVMDAWISRRLAENASLKFGLIDLNSEFDIQTPGLFFLNSSDGIGPDFSQTGENGPSIFPTTGLGLIADWSPSDVLDLSGGIFEGTPGNPAHPGRTEFNFSSGEGALLVLETRYRPVPDLMVGLGGWHYTAGFSQIGAGGSAHGNSGAYAIAETTLWREAEDGEHLDAWMRLGLANARINPIRSYLGGGLVYFGPFGRNSDQIGLGVSHAVFGRPARVVDGLTGSETIIETSYSFVWNDWVTLQPDFQYIASPGGDPGLDDAVVGGMRLILSWQ